MAPGHTEIANRAYPGLPSQRSVSSVLPMQIILARSSHTRTYTTKHATPARVPGGCMCVCAMEVYAYISISEKIFNVKHTHNEEYIKLFFFSNNTTIDGKWKNAQFGALRKTD